MSTSTQTGMAAPARWHHIRLAAEQLAEHEHERMKLLFNWAYTTANKPQGMSLWIACDNEDGADMYLSPQAAPRVGELIQLYQARPCGPPACSTVVVAGDGYGTYEPYARAVSTRNMNTTRRFLPVPYSYRCIRSPAQGRADAAPPYTEQRMAPFVRRYAEAWALSLPPR